MHQRHRARFSSLLLTALVGFSTLVRGVTLSDFEPYANNLTDSCNYVYRNTIIEGCAPSDFTTGHACSAGCVAGMNQLNELVKQACSGNSQNEQFVIAAFLNGIGVSSLCPNTAQNSGSDTSSSSSQALASSSSSTTSSSSTCTSSSVITSGTLVEPSPTASNSNLIIDTSATPTPSSMVLTSASLTISQATTSIVLAPTSSFVTSASSATSIPPPLFATASLPSQATATGSSPSDNSASCIEHSGTLLSQCDESSTSGASAVVNNLATPWTVVALTGVISALSFIL